MSKIKVGVNLPQGTNFDNFESVLTRIKSDGFDAVEMNLSAFNMIIGGKISDIVTNYVKNIMQKFDFVFTAHICYGLDLRNLDEREMHLDVLRASIDVCNILGIGVLNIHFEERSYLKQLETAYKDAIVGVADYAEGKNVLLVIENVEVERVHFVTEFVKDLNHRNVKMNLDLGHLFLSCNYFGDDFIKSVEDCADVLSHIHINDNTGDFEMMRITEYHVYNTLNINHRITFGRGDIHLPPLWGKVPMREVFKIIKNAGYNGVYMCEYYSGLYKPFNKDICANVREAIINS